MTEDTKPKVATTKKKKPPTQTAGVSGIDGHGGMGEAPIEPPIQPVEFQQYVDWHKLVNLPAFEMFVFEESGLNVGAAAREWVKQRRATLSDSVLYDQYAIWHEAKGLWVNETPTGGVTKGLGHVQD